MEVESSDNELTPPRPKPKRTHLYNYKKAWEKGRPWLKIDPGSKGESTEFCICTQCPAISRKPIRADLYSVKQHEQTKTHRTSVENGKKAENLTPASKMQRFLTNDVKEEIKILEIRIATQIADSSAIRSSDEWAKLLRDQSREPKFKNLRLGRTKCSRILSHVVAPSILQDLVRDVGRSYFSLLVDGSTDISTQKMLAIVIRYFSHSKGSIVTSFYRMLAIDSETAEVMANAVLDTLKLDGLSVSNLLGLGVDNTNSNIGKNNSLFTRLREKQPDLILLRCVCHSLHLAASAASAHMPQVLEFMCETTYSWFSRSHKRFVQFETIDKAFGGQEHCRKFVQLSQTRWLSRFECIRRLIESWDALGQYFMDVVKQNERDMKATMLSQAYSDKMNLVYLKFLVAVMKEFHTCNLLFQAETPNPLRLLDDLKMLNNRILARIVKPEAMENMITPSEFSKFDFENHLLPITSVEFGHEFDEALEAVPVESRHKDYRERCFKVLLEAGRQVRQRLPESFDNLSLLKFMEPSRIVGRQGLKLRPLVLMFKHVLPSVEDVLSDLAVLSTTGETDWKSDFENPTEFWVEAFSKKDSSGNPKFEAVARFALGMLSMPFSNAAVERVFSALNIVKSRLRNRMQVRMVESVIRVRLSLRMENCHSHNMKISKDMLSRFRSAMYENLECESETIDVNNICALISDDAFSSTLGL